MVRCDVDFLVRCDCRLTSVCSGRSGFGVDSSVCCSLRRRVPRGAAETRTVRQRPRGAITVRPRLASMAEKNNNLRSRLLIALAAANVPVLAAVFLLWRSQFVFALVLCGLLLLIDLLGISLTWASADGEKMM